jgi:putative membrane protein
MTGHLHGMSGWDVAAVVGLGSMAVLYALGTRKLIVRGARVRRVERFAFWIGWLAAVAALVPPIDTLASRLFSAHMFQHEMLMLVAAPLIVAGRPILALLWAVPTAFRARVMHGRGAAAVTTAWAVLTLPVIAWALHGVTVWVWHVPALYEAAIRDESIHAIQHITFVGTAALFWWGLIYGRYGRAGYGASVLYVFSTLVHTGVLGAFFTLSGTPFYALYVERANAAGLDPVADQQLAGLIMWIPAGVVLTCFGLGLFTAWLAASERRTRWKEGRDEASHVKNVRLPRMRSIRTTAIRPRPDRVSSFRS